jgi:hypothetical protein
MATAANSHFSSPLALGRDDVDALCSVKFGEGPFSSCCASKSPKRSSKSSRVHADVDLVMVIVSR